MRQHHLIQQVIFEPDGGVQIGWVTPSTDVKAAGLVKVNTIVIPRGGQYDEEIDALIEAAAYLIDDVMEDFDKLPAPDPDKPAEE